MITIKLPGDIEATVHDGVWLVPENDELTRVLNEPHMQPPVNGHYAPSPDARMALHIIHTFGATLVSTDEPASEPGLIY